MPNATCIAATFDHALVKRSGSLLAKETKARNAVCLLAPTINIQRSPLGGRAFESFSEDPTLAGQLAADYVNGLQGSGVSATIKHFVANDQEHERNGSDSIIAPRPLREVYLRPFQIAQALSKPWAYMTSYNKLNGTHCSENKWLLDDVLRREWGHDGLIMSDWYGTYSVSDAVNAGLNLEMPGPAIWRAQQLMGKMLSAHKVDHRQIDRLAGEVLGWVQNLAKQNEELVYAAPKAERTRTEAKDEDAEILRQVAAEGIVLLKNEGGVLPIKDKKVAVIGPNAKARVLTGGGSARLKSAWSSSPWEGLVDNKPANVTLDYSYGCHGAKYLPTLDECFTCEDGSPGIDLHHFAIVDGKKASSVTVRDKTDNSDMFLADYFHPDLGADYCTDVHAVFTSPMTGDYEFSLTITGQAYLYVDDVEVVENAKDQVLGEAFFNNGTLERRGSVKVEKGKVRSSPTDEKVQP